MALQWTKEDAPVWDADKQRLFGPAELSAVGMAPPSPGQRLADEWWRVTDDQGAVVGYGWLDSEWGDAQITFFVDPSRRGDGIGTFIVDRLEEEAGERGLNYVYNVIPRNHPDPAFMAHWLSLHGFVRGTGDLRRRVRRATARRPA